MRRNAMGLAGFGIVVFLLVVAVGANWLSPFDPNAQVGPRLTEPGPPFIAITTPMASATSSAVTPWRTADRAWATTQPSHSLVAEMASAINSFTLAGSAPSPMAARCSAAYPAYTSGMAARSRRPAGLSSSWISRAVVTSASSVAVVSLC